MTNYLEWIKIVLLTIFAFFLYKKGKDSTKLDNLEDSNELKDKYEDINSEDHSYDDIYLADKWMHKGK